MSIITAVDKLSVKEAFSKRYTR